MNAEMPPAGAAAGGAVPADTTPGSTTPGSTTPGSTTPAGAGSGDPVDGPVRRAVVVLGAVALLAGIAGSAVALGDGQALTEARGARVGYFHHTNPLGGIVTALLGGLAVFGGLRHLRPVVLVAGAGFVVAALTTLFRGAEPNLNVLGGTGSSLSVYLGLGIGLLVCGIALLPSRQA